MKAGACTLATGGVVAAMGASVTAIALIVVYIVSVGFIEMAFQRRVRRV